MEGPSNDKWKTMWAVKIQQTKGSAKIMNSAGIEAAADGRTPREGAGIEKLTACSFWLLAATYRVY